MSELTQPPFDTREEYDVAADPVAGQEDRVASKELKPCPFCGGTNLSIRLDDLGGGYCTQQWIAHVGCDNLDCGDVAGPCSACKYRDKGEVKEDAIRQWNRRVPGPATRYILDAVRSQVKPPAMDFSGLGGVDLPRTMWLRFLAEWSDVAGGE